MTHQKLLTLAEIEVAKVILGSRHHPCDVNLLMRKCAAERHGVSAERLKWLESFTTPQLRVMILEAIRVTYDGNGK